MKVLTATIFLAFITLSVLGFSSMAHGSDGHHEDCLFAGISQSACVFMNSGLNSVAHHLSSLQSSLQGIVNANGLALMLLLFVFSLTFAINIFKERFRFQFVYRFRNLETERPTANFLIELFSRGLLNPKVYSA